MKNIYKPLGSSEYFGMDYSNLKDDWRGSRRQRDIYELAEEEYREIKRLAARKLKEGNYVQQAANDFKKAQNKGLDDKFSEAAIRTNGPGYKAYILNGKYTENLRVLSDLTIKINEMEKSHSLNDLEGNGVYLGFVEKRNTILAENKRENDRRMERDYNIEERKLAEIKFSEAAKRAEDPGYGAYIIPDKNMYEEAEFMVYNAIDRQNHKKY